MGVEEKLRSFLSKSAEVSKNVLSKAGDAVQEFSDKSVIKIDKMKLENQRTKKISDLGFLVYDILRDSDDSISSETEDVKAIIEEIKNLDKEIAEKDELLKEFNDSEVTEKAEVLETVDKNE